MISRIGLLRVIGYKGIRAVEITPEGNIIQIRGPNGAGKTSILSAIRALFQWKKESKEGSEMPIHEGMDKAEIFADIGNYLVTRTFTSKGSYLTVKTRDGNPVSQPQEKIDQIIGDLALDPLAFSGMESLEQARTLAKIVGIDFDAINAKRKTIYDERTATNREVKRLAGERSAISSRYPSATKADREPVDVSALTVALQKANAEISEIDGIKNSITTHSEVLRGAEKRRSDIIEQLNKVESEISEERSVIESLNRGLVGRVVPDTATITKQIEDAGAINKRVDDLKRLDDFNVQLAAAEKLSSDMTSAIEEFDREKAALIAGANLPVPGLEFDEAGVTFNGIPFAGCSASEKLKVSCMLGMRLNPDLRVLRITDGSLLDAHSMKILDDLTRDENFQLWIEIVSDDPSGPGYFIENGEVVNAE